MKTKCAQCGTMFEKRTVRQKYCSKECKKRQNNKTWGNRACVRFIL